MENIGFWGWTAVAAAGAVLLVGLILIVVRRVGERKIDRATDYLKRTLKPVPIEGRRVDAPERG